MNIKSVQDILPTVYQPSRYLGSEVNTIRKDPDRVALRMALAFPDLYEIGTSHFGIQILYHILNGRPDVAAERVYAPGPDMEDRLKAAGLPLTSLETRTPLGAFDILGFSLLYELNYTNVLTMLERAGIPFYARDRQGDHPLIIAGGPCTGNPAPLAVFFDAMVIGEGEAVVVAMADAWLEWKARATGDREELLNAWAGIPGVFVPDPESGLPKYSDCIPIQRAIVNDLDAAPFPTRPVVPFGKPVHDRLRLEIARGCTRGCRFCQAGMIYRPARERSPSRLLSLALQGLAATGYEDLSLMSLSSGDYAAIAPLLTRLMDRCAADRVAVSLPSLRAGTLTPELMDLIRRVRKTGFTIAPEAGSQRLRNVINKNITESDILETVENACRLGWQVIKLYFMIGLPTETRADIEEMVDLVARLRRFKGPGGRRVKINVSVGTFIPKPHTPFQWSPQLSLSDAMERIDWLQEQIKGPGVRLKWQNPRASLLEGLWARGDGRLAPLLVTAHELGCRLDGWSDHLDFAKWAAAMEREGIDIDAYTTRPRDLSAPLPWDTIEIVDKAFLEAEWERARTGAPTGDCRDGDCNGCGVCDFETIRPRICTPDALDRRPAEAVGPTEPDRADPAGFRKVRAAFAKEGDARYFGHLEMVNIFVRALRRAAVPVAYSQGFHPMPKIAFSDPLPIGMESRCESFDLTVAASVRTEDLVGRLNDHLPEGLRLLSCRPLAGGKKRPDRGRIDQYRVNPPPELSLDRGRMAAFADRDEWIVTRTNRKGKLKKIDLKAMIREFDVTDVGQLVLSLWSVPGKTVRPAEVLREIFAFPEDAIQQSRIVKTATAECYV